MTHYAREPPVTHYAQESPVTQNAPEYPNNKPEIKREQRDLSETWPGTTSWSGYELTMATVASKKQNYFYKIFHRVFINKKYSEIIKKNSYLYWLKFIFVRGDWLNWLYRVGLAHTTNEFKSHAIILS